MKLFAWFKASNLSTIINWSAWNLFKQRENNRVGHMAAPQDKIKTRNSRALANDSHGTSRLRAVKPTRTKTLSNLAHTCPAIPQDKKIRRADRDPGGPVCSWHDKHSTTTTSYYISLPLMRSLWISAAMKYYLISHNIKRNENFRFLTGDSLTHCRNEVSTAVFGSPKMYNYNGLATESWTLLRCAYEPHRRATGSYHDRHITSWVDGNRQFLVVCRILTNTWFCLNHQRSLSSCEIPQDFFNSELR